MSLTTRERGLIHGGGLIFGWKNALLIWGAYIWGSLYTGGGLFMEFYSMLTSIFEKHEICPNRTKSLLTVN